MYNKKNNIIKFILGMWVVIWVIAFIIQGGVHRNGDGSIGVSEYGFRNLLLLTVIPTIILFGLIIKDNLDKKISMREKEKNISANHIDCNTDIKIQGSQEIFEFKRTGMAPINVIVEGNWLAIDRKGIYNKVQHGLDGIKKIHMKNISSVQFKEGSAVAAGYIQLAIQGSQENKGGFMSANSDENTIMFGASYNDLAKKLVNKIESKIDELQSNQPQTIINQPTQTIAQQLKEFKELLDEGIVTQEEFDKKKSELLG